MPFDLYRPDLFGVSALSSKGKVTITLLNVNDYEIEVCVVIKGKMVKEFLKPHSIVTYIC